MQGAFQAPPSLKLLLSATSQKEEDCEKDRAISNDTAGLNSTV